MRAGSLRDGYLLLSSCFVELDIGASRIGDFGAKAGFG